MIEEKKVLFPEDLVKETGLGISLVYRKLKSGEIPHRKCGTRYLISRSVFEKWLNGEHASGQKDKNSEK
jgi:excisionase family DNA binding protein